MVSLIFISFLLYHVCGLGRGVLSSLSFSFGLVHPCGRDGVRAHPRVRSRTCGTEQARHLPPEMVPVSNGRAGAVHLPWLPRNRSHGALSGASTRSAATYEA